MTVCADCDDDAIITIRVDDDAAVCMGCYEAGDYGGSTRRSGTRLRHPDGEAVAVSEAHDMADQRERLYRQQGRTSGGRRL